MAEHILGTNGDGDEVEGLGEGWVLVAAGDVEDVSTETDRFEVMCDVRNWSNLLEDSDEGEAAWQSAVDDVPYFNELREAFPPLYDPRSYDSLPGFELRFTETGGSMPGTCFEQAWLFVDEDKIAEVLEAFSRMSVLLKSACVRLGLQD